MSIKLSDSIRVGQQKPLEDKYFNELVPYTSTAQVNTLLPKAVRHRGLTVNINGEEYWYKDGIEDSNLVLKITNSAIYDLKNQEQDDRLENLEGINYVWSPTNRTLTLFDRGVNQLSQVSLVSLDNEGTDIRYNASTLSLELYNVDNELLDSIPVSSFIGSVGTQLQLNSNQLQLKDSQGNVLSTVNFEVSNISGLQTVLNNKLNTPTMTNNYYGLWDDVNKKFINGQLNQDTNGNIGIGATPTNSKVELSPLVNQTALKVLNYSLTGSNIQPALDINGTWNTSGNPTLIKASVTNTTSNANTLLMDLQVNGASQFSVRRGGVVTFNGPLYINSISNTTLSLMSFGGNGNESVLSNLANNSGTSGQKVFIDAAIGLNPTSGNSTLISFLSRPTINQTGGANGITRGLYINPTLTSAADWRSIEWSNNTGYGLYGTGTANNFLAGNLGIGKLLPVEKLDVNGNVKAIDFKGQAVKFNLQTSISPTPNTLVPKTDGSGLLWYDNNSVLRNIGENFFSADLSNTTARNHTMNAGVTVNTLGNPHTLSGLPNKNTDIANFRKVRVQNASGLDSIVDSKNLLTDGVTSMSDAEKDAWRIAQRKSNETYSIGQPQPFAVFPPIVENTNEIQEVVVVGSNLFLNNSSSSTALVCLVSETGTEYPLNVEVNQNNPTILSFGYNFSTLPLGDYWIKVVHNGLININKVYLQVTNNITPQPLPNLSWNGYRQASNTYFTNTNNTSGFVSFTSTAINFTRKYFAVGGTAPNVDEGNVFINSSAFNLPDDFYLEFSGTCPWQSVNGVGNRQPTISMGLSAYNSVFDISNTYIAGFGLDYQFQNSKLFSDVSTTLDMGDVTNFVFYVIKRGSKIVLGLKSKSGVLYSTYTAPAGNQFMIKLAHFNSFYTSLNTLISFALTKILSL